MTCSSSVDNYPNGIKFDPFTGTTLNVVNGTHIERDPTGDGFNGIYVSRADAEPITVNLADGVTIITEGLNAHGLQVLGSGNISTTSAANITVAGPAGPPPPGGIDATSGLFGYIENPASSGNITITQQENSTITASGWGGGGIYGLNYGSGSVTLTSSGTIFTTGDNGYGINAVNGSANGQDTIVRLNATGNVTTGGTDATGLFSLNYSKLGNAFVYVDGTITATGSGGDGALAQINDGPSNDHHGIAQVVVSNTANIHAEGKDGKGAWVLNYGLGDAIVISQGTVQTDGDGLSSGLHARIDNAASEAVARVSLERGGTVVTLGETAYGIYAWQKGLGLATVTMEGGTSVTTSGKLADGVRSQSDHGAASVTQWAEAPITVSGGQAFGVNVIGATSATADLRGAISSSGEYGVGASSFSGTESAEMTIAANAKVTGGWQADVTSTGTDTKLPSAGVLIGSGTSTSQLTNFGTIGAGSDRAIADIGRYQLGGIGNLVIDNAGLVTGFVELAGGGTNVFNNNASGVFAVRHFANTNGDIDSDPDTKRVAISDFGQSSTSIFNNFSGATVRLAPVTGETNVDPDHYYVPTTGSDSRPLETSYYMLGRSGVVQGQFVNLGEFHNAGIIDLRGSVTGNTLVMTGNPTAGGLAGAGVFISDGGQLKLNTVLNAGVAAGSGGQTGSYSDVLVVDSTRMGTGATHIIIDRREGTGATTPGNGILLVEVRDKTDGASAPGVFTLNGDYAVNGQSAVVKGAYAYNLFQNGVDADSNDGNWYLRNRGYGPNVPVYEDYPKVITPLINVPTLQQRVGNRYWDEPAPRPRQTVFCKDPAKNYQCTLTDEQARYYVNSDGTTVIENSGIWGRIEGAYGRYQPSQSQSGARFDANTQKIQVGLDGLFAEVERGKLIGGITANYGHVFADIMAPGSKGSIRADGYGFGGTLTWYGTNGFYVDAQAQATWIVSTLNSATLGKTLVDGNKGFGYALSIETGQRIALNKNWTLTPQAQLVYLDLRVDSFTDPFGAAVSLADSDSLRGRVGLALEHQERWKAENGTISRVSTYGIANIYNEFLKGPRVNVSGTVLTSRDDRLWGGLGVGGSYNWNNDGYSIYGQVLANTGLENFGDSFDVGGTLGLRVKW